ncbi:FAD-dependent oxidoreductase, partial [Pseudomonas aeruginosa]
MAQRVCIIGAGVVGLATAYALVREGFDVTPGGRGGGRSEG